MASDLHHRTWDVQEKDHCIIALVSLYGQQPAQQALHLHCFSRQPAQQALGDTLRGIQPEQFIQNTPLDICHICWFH